MRSSAIRGIGLLVSLAYGGFIAWLYLTQPQTLAEIAGGAAAPLGLYSVDAARLRSGRALLYAGRFSEARAELGRADPARRDPVTQFYVAYTYYREGWGRIYNDDALFSQALASLDRATGLAPGGRVSVDDPQLGLRDSDALRAELRRGLTVEAEDFNPLRIFRKRQ